MPWFVYVAIKQLFPSGKCLSLFSLLSILGVAIGVWMLIVVLSVMDGFLVETQERLIAANGHLKIEKGDVIEDDLSIIEMVKSFPQVDAVSPYAQGYVMVLFNGQKEYPLIRGFDSMNENPVVPLDSFLQVGKVEDLVDWTIMIGQGLAEKLGVSVGDTVEVYSPLILGRLKEDEMLLPESLEVAGIFSTGYEMIDGNAVIVTLRKMQDFYGLNDGVHGVSVRLKDGDDMGRVAAAINQELKLPYRAFSWLDENGDLYAALKTQKMIMFFIIVVISIVAAFSIAISLLTNVLRKTREIGLYGAFGGTGLEIGFVFALQGLFIGIVGIVLGFALAVVFLHFRNEILGTVAGMTGSQAALKEFYQFETLPLSYSVEDFVMIIVSAIAISTLAGLVPAWRASRLKPSEALRNE